MDNTELLIEQLEILSGKRVILAEEVKINLKKDFVLKLDTEEPFFAVVAIIFKGNKVLMGKSLSEDDRKGKLIFPGGHIDKGENPYLAAKREVREETGAAVKCRPFPIIEDIPTKEIEGKEGRKIAFVVCDYVGGKIKPNEEFEFIKWYSIKDLPYDEIYSQNIKILKSLLDKEKLNENKKLAEQNFLNKGLISQQEFNDIVNIDPSQTKKYVFWLVKKYLEEKIDLNELKNTITEFDALVQKSKVKNPDIFYYKTFSDLKKEIDELNKRGTASLKELENDYEVIVDNENLYIVSPQTHEASRKLGLTVFSHRSSQEGKDSAWCTTFKNAAHFDSYYLKYKVTFYYILVKGEEMIKKLKEVFPRNYKNLTKVAFAVLPDGKIDAYDAMDKQMSANDIKIFRKIIGV